MATKISTRKRSSMFRSFCARQANIYVAKHCHISPTTVSRYRTIDNWDERWAEIEAIGRAAAAQEEARAVAKMISDVGDIRANIIKRLIDITADDMHKITVWDLDKIIRLEQFIKGHPDARTEIVESPLDSLSKMIREFDENFKGKTVE
ncbi:MAG: hypothetical protein ABIH23_05240 [bacterium]